MVPKIIDKSIFDYGGKTYISLASDNNTLCISNKNGLTKVLQSNKPEEEPEVFETVKNLTSVHCDTDTSFIMTTNDGDVYRYNFKNNKDTLLARFSLPIRDSTIVHSSKMVAVGGDDLDLTLIELDEENSKKHVLKVDEQISQLSCSSQTNILSVSFINGNVQFFSLTSTIPNKVHELNDFIPVNSYNDTYKDKILKDIMGDATNDSDLDSDEEEEKIKDNEFCDENRICTRAAWNPRGLHFALPCKDMTVKIFTIKDYSLIRTLTTSENIKSNFIDLQFDPLHGNYIAGVDLNNTLTVWEWNTSKIIYTKNFKQKITNTAWRIEDDSKTLQLIMGTWSGAVITVQELAESINVAAGKDDDAKRHSNLFVDSDISEVEGEDAKARSIEEEAADEDENLFTQEEEDNKKRKFHFDDEEDFIDDDDGAGYLVNKKSIHSSVKFQNTNSKSHGLSKTPMQWRYGPMSPGATPYSNSDRRYLTMNNIGYVVTVRNNDQHSITVSFFDLGRFSEYHFEDLFSYDVCFLNEKATLFGQSKTGQLQYRPHDNLQSNWTKMIPLQRGERITCVAATRKRIFVGTSFGYLRTFNQFGLPLAVEKMSPIVALSAHEYKVFLVHYSPYHGVSYTLFEISPKTSKYYQRESSLPIMLPQGIPEIDEAFNSDFTSFNQMGIKSLFFSIYGDPCIFGNDNVLLILSKWRSTMESRWIPMLDANMEVWKMSSGNDSSDVQVWPLGLTFDTLNCILVKGKNSWPGFPLPLPSELEIRIPTLVKSQILQETRNKRKLVRGKEDGSIPSDDDDKEDDKDELSIPVNMAAEEEYLRSKVLYSLLNDTLENDGELYGNENEILASLTGNHDKSLLRLFAAACSDQDTDKALSIVQELKQDRALNAAIKISERAELMMVVRKINVLRESKFEAQMNTM